MSRPAPLSRLSGPGELAAALPVLCGFTPAESLVLVSLEPGGDRVGLTLRLDLPAPGSDASVALELGERLRRVGARRGYALVVTDAPGPRPFAGLVDALVRRSGLDLLDLLLVRDGRWRSYLCTQESCCPPEGTALPTHAPALSLLRAEAVLDGRAVLPSRAALVAALAPPPPALEHAERLRHTELTLAGEAVRSGWPALRRRLLEAVKAALRDPCAADEAELALALADVLVRDEVLTWAVVDAEPLLTLLLHLARCTPGPYDAGVCASLAWVAYSRGDGATASVALDRALDTDPEHGLAVLLRAALDRQVSPRDLREVALATARVLRP